MHIKHMHEMIEKLTDCTKTAMENDQLCVGKYPISDVVDMIKDLNEASYYASIVKAMDEAKEDEEEEEKYMLKRFKEEYGEEDGEKRFYDSWRYASGRFAPKGRGSYMPRSSSRRGYEEPPYYHMTPEMMREHDPEYWRDLDRSEGRLYYTETMPHMARTSDMGRMDGMRDHREGKSGQSRRTYMETKEIHKGNTPQDKQEKMKSLESYMKELAEDVTEMVEDASNEEKTMLKAKLQTLVQKIQ